MENIITEFFGEFIYRILPGAALLGIYPDKVLNPLLLKFQWSQTLLIASLLGIAWVLGFAVERASYFPALLRHKLWSGESRQELLDRVTKDYAPGVCDFDKELHIRLHRLKHAHEVIFCRVAFTISGIAYFFKPTSATINSWEPLKIYCCTIPIPLIGMVVFGGSWLLFRITNLPAPKETKSNDHKD